MNALIFLKFEGRKFVKTRLLLSRYLTILWNKWWNIFEIYKNGCLACSPKSIMQYYFVHNKIKQYTLNIFRPLRDLDERQLHKLVDKILEGYVSLSTTVDHSSQAETLEQYCRCIKDERATKNIICDYYR